MQGLTEQEVKQKQQEYGLNEISRKQSKSKLLIIKEIISDPIIIIMTIALIISILSGHGYAESYVIGTLIMVNITISFVQEIKTVAKLKALAELNEATVQVIRSGKEKEIKAKYLVVGDIVKLAIGTIARADLQIIEATDLRVDESFLTGESDEVSKEKDEYIYSNSPITNGYAITKVVAIGMDSRIGKIAAQVDEVEAVKSQLEIKILTITKVLLKFSIVTSAIIFILALLNGYDLTTSFSFLISILIATVPEGLATVLTIVLTYMSQKMAKSSALIKQTKLLETLGEVSYVCSDKTGTITENKMKVTEYKFYADNDLVVNIINNVVMANTPTTKAIVDVVSKMTTINEDVIINEEIPFSSSRKKSLTRVNYQGKEYVIGVGAPDYLVDSNAIEPDFSNYGKIGLRTLLVAFYELSEDDLFNDTTMYRFKPLALFGIQDPPKQAAMTTIKDFHQAGIVPVMITGDNANTAISIARQTGIIDSENDLALTGSQVNEMSENDLKKIVKNVKVYSRVSPENKVQIVRALQSHGEIVAMTGDGTNDSIAMKQANIGIAMGRAGTDVAKESADLILLDDNYQTIEVAIRGGRQIFSNLQKFMRQMLTANAAHTGSILFTLIIGLVLNQNLILPMTPILILWINIVSDAIPCLALGIDNEEADIMQVKPIDPNLNILTKPMVIEILLRGLTIGLLVFIIFTALVNKGMSEQYARSVGFIVLSFGQLIHIFDARSTKTIFKKNPFNNRWLLFAVITSILLNLSLLYTPLSTVFGLEAISGIDLLTAILVSSIPTLGYSLIKLIILKCK